MTEVLHGLEAANRDRVAALRTEREFFWLDASLSETSHEALAEALGIPERALEALSHISDVYASRAFHADGESIVFALRCYVEAEAPADEAGYRLRPVEVRLLITGGYLLTLHDEPLSLPALLAPDLPPERSDQYVVYSVLEAMLTSTSYALEEVELRLDSLSARWTDGGAGNASRVTLQAAGGRLATMRRWSRAEEALFERVALEIGALRGFETSDDGYFDRLDEQVSRLLASIDAASNAVGMLLDLQLNERAYVVSVIATIFVPLTFITGFFGMNFGWMVDQVDTPMAFWVLGFIVPVVTAGLAWGLLVRRFMGDDR